MKQQLNNRKKQLRVQKTWRHWTAGYAAFPCTTIANITLRLSLRTATIGYTSNGKIVGISKLTRLIDCFARSLQVQERLTIRSRRRRFLDHR